MKIKVLYFASLRENLGRTMDDIETSQALTVLDAWKMATGQDEMPEKFLTAVNQEYTSLEKLLKDGDEVAFFPPVTGG